MASSGSAPWRSSSWDADPKKKQKEEVFLSRTKLCVFHFQDRCRNGRDCNFAHSLQGLLMPEESQGNWSEAFRNGDVDINFWPNYTPSRQSASRFRAQFMWEIHNQVKLIPNWAWGHALKLKIIHSCHVPPWVPEDFEWPEMQRRWYEQKQHGQPTAYNLLCPNVAVLWQRQDCLRQAWLDSPQKGKGKGKGTVKGEKGQGKGKGMGQGQKGKGNGKGMDQGDSQPLPGAWQGQWQWQGNVPPPATVTRPNLDPADPTLPPKADMPPGLTKMQLKEDAAWIHAPKRPQTEEEPKEEPEEVPCQGEGPPGTPPIPPEGLPECEAPAPPPPPPPIPDPTELPKYQ